MNAPAAQSLLEEMAQEMVEDGRTPSAPLPTTSAATTGKIKKLNYSHDAFIDLIIATPGITQAQIAAAFGYTPAWVCNVMASDLFQARLEERRQAIVDPALVQSVEERSKAIFQRSAAVLMEKLDQPTNSIDDKTVLRALELSSKNLGIGGNAPPAPQVDPERLKRMEARLLALRGGEGARVIEGEVLSKEPLNG